MKVTSDQSVAVPASAAALTIPIGLPTTWLCIDAPKARPSCQPCRERRRRLNRPAGEAERHN
jgi:hypothetical protein